MTDATNEAGSPGATTGSARPPDGVRADIGAARAVVVTGASTGIGKAAVMRLAAEGFHVFGGVRRSADAAKLSSDLGERASPLQFDVRDQAATDAAAAETRAALNGRTLAGLVVNAGVAIPGPFLEQPIEEHVEQLETNLMGAFRTVKAFGPLLTPGPDARGDPGRIVIVGSLAGKVSQPFATAYVASKHGLEGFAVALRRELVLHGVRVSLVGPATVRTPIWRKAEALGVGRFDHTVCGAAYRKNVGSFLKTGREQGMPAEDVAAVILHALTAARPKRRYSPARRPLIEQALIRAAPDGVLDRLLSWKLGFGKPRERS